jgi:hypothetical protein
MLSVLSFNHFTVIRTLRCARRVVERLCMRRESPCAASARLLASLPFAFTKTPFIERVRRFFAGFCRVSGCVTPAIFVEQKRRQDAGGPKCAGTGSGRRGEPSRRLTPTSNLRNAPAQSSFGHRRRMMRPPRSASPTLGALAGSEPPRPTNPGPRAPCQRATVPLRIGHHRVQRRDVTFSSILTARSRPMTQRIGF